MYGSRAEVEPLCAMADPLSISASIITVLQFTSTVIGCVSEVSTASKDRQRVLLEVCSTQGILSALRDLGENTGWTGSWTLTVKSLNVPGGPLVMDFGEWMLLRMDCFPRSHSIFWRLCSMPTARPRDQTRSTEFAAAALQYRHPWLKHGFSGTTEGDVATRYVTVVHRRISQPMWIPRPCLGGRRIGS